MTKIYYGVNEFQKVAARIAFYNINRQVPTERTPIIYDEPGQRVVYAPNAGFAAHYLIADWMDDKGWDVPAPNQQAHGYYWPDTDSFEWYGTPYIQPSINLQEAFKSGIKKSIPQKKQSPTPRLCNFKWAAMGYEEPEDTISQRPVIYWVNEDTVYLGRPNGAHYQVYEEMEDDGFDNTEEGGQEEVHGYFNYQGKHDLYWYEPGAYGYEVNRLPIGDEEERIKATIFNALGIPWTATAKVATRLPLEIDEEANQDDHGGGVAWIYDGNMIHVTAGEGHHSELDNAQGAIEYGRFLPQDGRVLFYDQEAGYGSGERKEWTELHDDIVQTLRAHTDEILSYIDQPTSLEQSAIAGQHYDDPDYAWFRMVD